MALPSPSLHVARPSFFIYNHHTFGSDCNFSSLKTWERSCRAGCKSSLCSKQYLHLPRLSLHDITADHFVQFLETSSVGCFDTQRWCRFPAAALVLAFLQTESTLTQHIVSMLL